MLAQLECPGGQTQALHRQRLVLVLLALVLYRHRLVLVLLAAPPTADAACAGAPPGPAPWRQHVACGGNVEVSLRRVVDASGQAAAAAAWVVESMAADHPALHVAAAARPLPTGRRASGPWSCRGPAPAPGQCLVHLLQCCYHHQLLVHCWRCCYHVTWVKCRVTWVNRRVTWVKSRVT